MVCLVFGPSEHHSDSIVYFKAEVQFVLLKLFLRRQLLHKQEVCCVLHLWSR